MMLAVGSLLVLYSKATFVQQEPGIMGRPTLERAFLHRC